MSVATSSEAELDAMKREKLRESCHRPHHHRLQLAPVPLGDLRASTLEDMDGLFSGDVPFGRYFVIMGSSH